MKKFYDCGIDLGTTNSCIAIPDGPNACTIIDNIADRMRVTPSAVWISRSGRTVVGQRAYTCVNTGEVRREFKRDMGTETVYEFAGSGARRSPEELSAEILRSLRRDAASRTGVEMRDAVITVPAAFNMIQCEATRKAAQLAGFDSVVLLQEPIAASIAYGARPDAKDQYWLVFDYGGGTLDVSVISTKEGRLENITSKGDNHMGGKDLDRLLFERVILPRLRPQYDVANGLSDPDRAVLMQDVERCKTELSTQPRAFFETYSARDRSGQIIDCSFEVTREAFEAAISGEITRAVAIARDALDFSRVPEGSFSKIILVGGTTFIPAVREALRNAFSIPLDCSLDPMTVVAEGAALYAALTVVEADVRVDPPAAGCCALDLEFSPVTSETVTNVVGRVIGAEGAAARVKIDCVAADGSESALWTSGWCEMLDVRQSVFDIDVRVCTRGGLNRYRVSVSRADGTALKLTDDGFAISHTESSLKLSAPPLPHAIGVLVTNGKDNFVDWIIDKDTRLPVRRTQVYALNRTLNPAENTECEFRFYEGDNTLNPDANALLRAVHIRSRDLSRTLIAGTDVELTISIDESRCVTVDGYVPAFDLELLSEKLSSSEENYVNYYQEMEKLEAKFTETSYTLDVLARGGADVFALREELRAIREDYDRVYELIDTANDEVHRYLRRFYDLQTRVILMEREGRDLREQNREERDLKRMDGNITTYGNAKQIEAYKKLRGQLDGAGNPDSRRYLLGKIDELETDVFRGSFEWVKAVYLSVYDRSEAFTDPNKAAYWKTQAREAIREHDDRKLREAYNALFHLRVRSADQSVSEKQADLKKV